MADRAEQRALEVYPVEADGCDMYLISRTGYIAGYHQAEKDLALTWTDMLEIHRHIKDAMNYNLYKMMEGVEGQKEVYQNVLKRFLESKKV